MELTLSHFLENLCREHDAKIEAKFERFREENNEMRRTLATAHNTLDAYMIAHEKAKNKLDDIMDVLDSGKSDSYKIQKIRKIIDFCSDIE